MKRVAHVVLGSVLALSLTACASPSSPAIEASTTEASREASGERPASVTAIESLLSARHVEDLPDAQTLSSHSQPAASLRYIATHHRRMVVRGRALSALRTYDDDATAALLFQTLSDPAAHPTLRAAAARGTAALPLDAGLREALAAARATDDPRVVRAVHQRLEGTLTLVSPEPDGVTDSPERPAVERAADGPEDSPRAL